MIVFLRHLSITYNAILIQAESIFGYPRSKFTSTALRIFLFPSILLIMVAYKHHGASSKWVQTFNEVLMVFIATYLTLVALVECTVRIIFLKVGIGLESTVASMSRNPDQLCVAGRRRAALHRSIERSLVETIGAQEDTGDSHCCSICLETFNPGVSIVSGRRDCCKSNVFHKECIQQWLSINDSCPCCRQPMREEEDETEESDSDINGNDNRDFWHTLKIQIDTTARLRNEILSYFVEKERAMRNPYRSEM